MNKLIIEYEKVLNVDELNIPLVPSTTLRNFEVIDFCCKELKTLDEEYGFNVKGDSSIYPDILKSGKDALRLIIQTVSGEWGDETDLEVPCCVFCQTKPTFKISKTIKKIRKCIEKSVTKIEKECEYTEMEIKK